MTGGTRRALDCAAHLRQLGPGDDAAPQRVQPRQHVPDGPAARLHLAGQVPHHAQRPLRRLVRQPPRTARRRRPPAQPRPAQLGASQHVHQVAMLIGHGSAAGLGLENLAEC